MSHQYEIEIKSLLGDADKAFLLRDNLSRHGGKLITKGRQLNHYFIVSNIAQFKEKLKSRLKKERRELFEKTLTDAKDVSIRTRDTDGEVKLVVKASIGSDTSSNGISRMEFEEKMDITLDKLDKLLLDAGLKYQAKWSREREEYKLNDINVCLDRNAGYGYLAEFEKVVPDPNLSDSIKQELLAVMKGFGVVELPQDRLERMFSYYNNNWKDYYGTDKIFNIE